MFHGDKFTRMEQLLYLILGWLLGLLGPGIVERIRRRYRISELTQAIVAELGELSYTLALSAYLFCRRTGSLTDEALDWIVLAISRYSGPLADARMVESVKRIRSLPEVERIAIATTDTDRGLSLKLLSLPLLEAHLSEMALFPVAFQTAVLRVRGQVDVYNQHVQHLQGQFNLTFTVTDPTNDAALRTNQIAGFQQLSGMAKMITDLIAIVPGPNKGRP